MKECVQCGVEINDIAVFCTKCGSEQPKVETTSYCAYCGKELAHGAKFCNECGNAVLQPVDNNQVITQRGMTSYASNSPLKILADKERIVGIFWLIVAGFQGFITAILFLDTVTTPLYYFESPAIRIITIIMYAAVCGLNIANGISSLRVIRVSETQPNWYGKRYEKAGSYISTIVYNSIIFIDGVLAESIFAILVGTVALIVSTYSFSKVRAYALENATYFQQTQANRR